MNHSLGSSGVMGEGGAGAEQVYVLVGLLRAVNTSQVIVGCIGRAVGGLEGF